MNGIDAIVIVLLVTSVVRGAQVGFIRQFFSTLGFAVGIMAGVWVGNLAANFVSDPGGRTLLSSMLLFLLSFGLMAVGETIGADLKQRLNKDGRPHVVDSVFGTMLSIITYGLALWFITAFVALMPLGGIQKTMRNSFAFNWLDRHLPPASQLLSGLNHYFHLNDAPQVFSGREPAPDSSLRPPVAANYGDVFEKAEPSIVRVQGLGCGGLVNGTGFLLSKTRVMTNAHVVAGVSKPTVRDSEGSHDATVVLFDPKLDLAVLATETLDETPLPLAAQTAVIKDVVLLSGFPKGGARQNGTGIIAERVQALGRDIYNQSKTIRDVYVMRATVVPGNSGSPILNEKGEVTGVVFGTSTTYTNVGYALTLDQIKPTIQAASSAREAQSTGACSEI